MDGPGGLPVEKCHLSLRYPPIGVIFVLVSYFIGSSEVPSSGKFYAHIG